MAKAETSARAVKGECLCGAVTIEFDYPAFWAWHDHSLASRRAHGAVYATYIGVWRKKVRITKGAKSVGLYEDAKSGSKRSFCLKCGSPLIYERRSSKSMINLPRALFTTRTGREPRYHLNTSEMQDWNYSGAPLAPLKGYPGVLWERPKSRRKKREDDPLAELMRTGVTNKGAPPSRKPRPS